MTDTESVVVTTHTTDTLIRERELGPVDALLERNDLVRDPDISVWALARTDGRLIGCMGLAGEVIKCSAVDAETRGQNLLARLLVELRYAALSRGHSRLFVYTRPSYRRVFASLGFRLLAEVPDLVVLMEDDPGGIERYVRSLAASRREASTIGSAVINANPFTLGHQHLVRQAARACEVVHVFVVGEDRSEFSYRDRFTMVDEGIAAMPEQDRIVLHGGSRYIVSNSTFPQYFLRDAAAVHRAHAGIDLQLFRIHIAPALGIRHRFVGTEPASRITAQYNTEMAHWLQTPDIAAPPIELHRIERIGTGTEAFISASRVRALLARGDLEGVRALVPPTTYAHLTHRTGQGGPS